MINKINSAKQYLFFAVFVGLNFLKIGELYAQSNKSSKPSLDSNALNNWEKVQEAKISDDGKFVSYKISRHQNLLDQASDLIVQSSNGIWKRTFRNVASPLSFVSDNKRAVLRLSGDSLGIIYLGTNKASYITGITSYLTVRDFLIYQTKGMNDSLIVESIRSGKKRNLGKVISYSYNHQKNMILLSRQDEKGMVSLSQFFLKNNFELEFWKGNFISDIIYDNLSNQISFRGKCAGKNSIYLYRVGEKGCKELIDIKKLETDSSITLTEITKFSQNGKSLFFRASSKQDTVNIKYPEKTTKLVIWKHSDARLYSESEKLKGETPSYDYIADIDDNNLTRLTYGNEVLESSGNEFAIIRHKLGLGNIEEISWNPYSQEVFYRVFYKNKKRVRVDHSGDFSPSGKYFIHYKPQEKGCFIENVSNEKIVNITATLAPKGAEHIKNRPLGSTEVSKEGITWLSDDSILILFTRRDIWQVDPEGIKKPICLTNGYGVKNNIFFNPVNNFTLEDLIFGKKLILTGFDYDNKNNGFYEISYGKIKDPEKLIMDRHHYFVPYEPIENGYGSFPIKAAKSNTWLVRRMSAKESPNYFITSDFKSFHAISSVYPEREYNWLTTSLHKWKSLSGDSLQGILYKPEDFDSNKKYPIIFHYYNDFARNLNAFLDPETSTGAINIPWYVSRGYLVFVPDIEFRVGKVGQSSFDAVVSAADYMKTFSFVDSTKMGLQGHSFGGYQTNYIYTHTNMFAAALESSGVSNIASFAGTISWRGRSNHFNAEKGQLATGVAMWDDANVYIKNSPIFSVNNVKTPLLMMGTTDDFRVPFGQAIEFFTALRRLKKPVWLLEYKGENHILNDNQNRMDYTIKQTEFFDHFLMGRPAPEWMLPNEIK